MKFAVIALATATAGLLAAGAAQASDKVSDVDFLRANRCKGLASQIHGVVDPASLNAFIKSEEGARAQYIVERADEEFQRARKEAKSEDRRDRLTAELTGPCQAFVSGGANLAKK